MSSLLPEYDVVGVYGEGGGDGEGGQELPEYDVGGVYGEGGGDGQGRQEPHLPPHTDYREQAL